MKKLSKFGGAAVTALGLATSAGHANPFGAGSLVVVRYGDGSASLTSSSAAAFLEERSPVDGSLIQAIALPTAASGANGACTVAGSSTAEGFLTLASNNQYLLMGGYNTVPATGSVASTAPATVSRVVARIALNGTIDTTTQFSDVTGNIRSVVSDNGTSNIWATSSSNGVRYGTFGAVGTTTQIASSPTNTRVLNIVGGQLYCSASSGAFNNVFTVGAGLPTSSGQTCTTLSGMPTSTGHSNYDYFFADANTLYVADDGNSTAGGGIQKWTNSGGTWSNAYNLGSAVRGLTGKVTGGTTTLWATTGSNLVTVTDTGAGSAVTTLAPAPTLTAFRGVRVLPGTFGGVIDGACCALDGTCSTSTNAGCAATGGTYQGDFTTCGSANCPQPGSCCFSGGTCLILAGSQCTAQGGTYGGNGTSCATANCGPRSGACCASNGTCSVVAAASCTGSGTYRGDGTTCATANCGSFTAGNLVVLEVTDITGNTGNSVYLREITPAGVPVQAIGLPAVRTEAGNRALTVNGASTTEGELQRSNDGHYLVLMGYNVSDNTGALSGTTASRVVGRIDSQGVTDTTTAFTDHTFEGSSPRGAASVDGSAFWLCGDATNLADRGIRYATIGSNASLQLNTDTTNNRDIGIFDGNLYYSTGSSPTGVNQLGTGVPTVSGQTTTNLTTNINPQGFFMVDVAGITYLYTGANTGSSTSATQAGITKYHLDSGAWLLDYVLDGGGTITLPIQQLTGFVNNGSVTLFGTTGEGSNSAATAGNKLYRIDDNGTSFSTYTLLASAQGTAVWKGVAFAPIPAAVACYANCDSSTTVPFLNVGDFTCFLQKYAAGAAYANCDNSTQAPVLNVADFTCFLQKFAAGCSAP
jgi:hypothetical protein